MKYFNSIFAFLFVCFSTGHAVEYDALPDNVLTIVKGLERNIRNSREQQKQTLELMDLTIDAFDAPSISLSPQYNYNEFTDRYKLNNAISYSKSNVSIGSNVSMQNSVGNGFTVFQPVVSGSVNYSILNERKFHKSQQEKIKEITKEIFILQNNETLLNLFQMILMNKIQYDEYKNEISERIEFDIRLNKALDKFQNFVGMGALNQDDLKVFEIYKLENKSIINQLETASEMILVNCQNEYEIDSLMFTQIVVDSIVQNIKNPDVYQIVRYRDAIDELQMNLLSVQYNKTAYTTIDLNVSYAYSVDFQLDKNRTDNTVACAITIPIKKYDKQIFKSVAKKKSFEHLQKLAERYKKTKELYTASIEQINAEKKKIISQFKYGINYSPYNFIEILKSELDQDLKLFAQSNILKRELVNALNTFSQLEK